MCDCSLKNVYEGNEADEFKQKYLQVKKVNALKWEALYRCKHCGTYWEETYKEERFVGIPELKKVDESYIISV